jgi:hypothetical protein
LTAGTSCRRWNIKLIGIHGDIKGILDSVNHRIQHG